MIAQSRRLVYDRRVNSKIQAFGFGYGQIMHYFDLRCGIRGQFT